MKLCLFVIKDLLLPSPACRSGCLVLLSPDQLTKRYDLLFALLLHLRTSNTFCEKHGSCPQQTRFCSFFALLNSWDQRMV